MMLRKYENTIPNYHITIQGISKHFTGYTRSLELVVFMYLVRIKNKYARRSE